MWCNSGFPVIAEIITKYTGLFTQRNSTCCTNEVIPLSCDIFTPLMKKVRDFVLLQEPSCTWRRHSASINAASQNEVIHLWCNSRLSSHWRIMEQDYSSTGTDVSIQMKWVLCDVIYLHRWWKRSEISTCCRKDPILIHQAWLLLAKMKWLICDVIPDSHLIGGRWNRTSNPRERIFPSKLRTVATHRNWFWWKKEEILSSCKNASIIYVFDKGIHQTQILLAKMKWLICDVIPDSHLIGGMTEQD